jgi:hypothetical protein
MIGAAFAAILAIAAAAEVDRDAPATGDPAEVVDSADPGMAQPAPAADAARGGPAGSPRPAGPGGAALADSGPILIDRAERANGWALERVLEPSGEVVEHEVDRAGTVQACRTVGSLFRMRVLEQAARGGEVVEVVRDASGALLRFAVDPDGEPRAVALLAPPPR